MNLSILLHRCLDADFSALDRLAFGILYDPLSPASPACALSIKHNDQIDDDTRHERFMLREYDFGRLL